MQAANIPISPTTEDEYADDWLKIDAESFDHMLEKTIGTSKGTGDDAVDFNEEDNGETLEDRATQNNAKKLQELAGKVEKFVQGEGDLEGALFEELVFF